MLAGCVPWPEEFAARYRAEGYWEDITIPEMLERTIRAVPDKTAIVIGERRISYRELGRLIDRMAYAFVRRGLKPLDRVVFQMINSAELAAYLSEMLVDAQIAVAYAPKLAMLDEFLVQLAKEAMDEPPELAALKAEGMTVERLRAFADGAARYYLSQPWTRC